MVMVPVPSADPTAVDMPVLPAEEAGVGTYKYVVQDVQFRIDVVGNDGFGDTEDYMLRDVQQESTSRSTIIKWGPKWGSTWIGVSAFYL